MVALKTNPAQFIDHWSKCGSDSQEREKEKERELGGCDAAQQSPILGWLGQERELKDWKTGARE